MTSVPRDVNYTMDQLIARRPFGEQNPVFEDMLAPTNQLLLGNVQRTATASGKTATVKAGEDIRPALNSLKSAGGGTLILLAGTHRPTYDIVGDSKINIVGEGVDQTIIDFGGGNYQFKYVGTDSSLVTNFKVENITVQNASANEAILFSYCDNFTVSNVLVDNSATDSFVLDGCQYFNIIFLSVTSSGRDSLIFRGNTDRDTAFFYVQNFFAINGTRYGMHLDGTNRSVIGGVFLNNDINSSGNHNYYLNGAGAGCRFINCQAATGTGDGFRVETNQVFFLGCDTNSHSTNGFYVDGTDNQFIGCTTSGGDVVDFSNLTSGSDTALIMGCNFVPTGFASNNTLIQDKKILAINNFYESPATENLIKYVKNTLGSTISAGEVVTLKSVANGEEITLTSVRGDNKVYGVAQDSISNNAVDFVHTQGQITTLKVNGTDDIAVGDYLATYSSAGIAAKARAGDQVFAIALEAYTTDDSNGVIDAYILPWRFPLVEYSDLRAIEESSLNYRPVEVIDSDLTEVGNVGTGEDDLITYTLPANSLANTGEAVKIIAWGTTANNANAKTVRLYFGSTELFSFNLTTNTINSWRIEAYVVRDSVSVQKATATMTYTVTSGSSALGTKHTAPNQTLSSSVVIKCTGEATSNNDIVQEGLIVELLHQ